MWLSVAMSKMSRSDFNPWLRVRIIFPVYISPTWCLMMKTISRVSDGFLRQSRVVGWTREPRGLKHPQGGYRIRKRCQFPKFQPSFHTPILGDGEEGKELRRTTVISSQCSPGGHWWGLWMCSWQRTGKSSDAMNMLHCLIKSCVRFLLLHNNLPHT